MVKITAVILSSLLVASVSIGQAVSQEAQVSESNDLNIFKSRLSDYIKYQKAVTETSALDSREVREALESSNKLWSFTDEFPNSKYANDARKVLIVINFLGALSSNEDNSINKWLKNMENLENSYPDAKMQNSTIQSLKDFWGEAPVECFMTNSDLLIRMKADIAFHSKDYDSAIEYFSLLKEKLADINEPTGLLAAEIYTYLASSYDYLGKFDDELNIAKEGLSRFPDNEQLKRYMEKVTKRISSR